MEKKQKFRSLSAKKGYENPKNTKGNSFFRSVKSDKTLIPDNTNKGVSGSLNYLTKQRKSNVPSPTRENSLAPLSMNFNNNSILSNVGEKKNPLDQILSIGLKRFKLDPKSIFVTPIEYILRINMLSSVNNKIKNGAKSSCNDCVAYFNNKWGMEGSHINSMFKGVKPRSIYIMWKALLSDSFDFDTTLPSFMRKEITLLALWEIEAYEKKDFIKQTEVSRVKKNLNQEVSPENSLAASESNDEIAYLQFNKKLLDDEPIVELENEDYKKFALWETRATLFRTNAQLNSRLTKQEIIDQMLAMFKNKIIEIKNGKNNQTNYHEKALTGLINILNSNTTITIELIYKLYQGVIGQSKLEKTVGCAELMEEYLSNVSIMLTDETKNISYFRDQYVNTFKQVNARLKLYIDLLTDIKINSDDLTIIVKRLNEAKNLTNAFDFDFVEDYLYSPEIMGHLIGTINAAELSYLNFTRGEKVLTKIFNGIKIKNDPLNGEKRLVFNPNELNAPVTIQDLQKIIQEKQENIIKGEKNEANNQIISNANKVIATFNNMPKLKIFILSNAYLKKTKELIEEHLDTNNTQTDFVLLDALSTSLNRIMDMLIINSDNSHEVKGALKENKNFINSLDIINKDDSGFDFLGL